MKPLIPALTLSLAIAQAQVAPVPEVKPQPAPTPTAEPSPEVKPKAVIVEETGETKSSENLPDPSKPLEPSEPSEPSENTTPATPEKPKLSAAVDPEKLFKKGFALGRVGDSPTGSYRRLIQRTVMIGEEQQAHRAILTFDDQILPTDSGHSSAMDIAKDLQPRGVRAIFFANVPAVSEKSLDIILKRTSDRATQKEQVLELLNSKRAGFVKGIRDLLALKKGDLYICEVFNHTAFHQNMTHFKVGTARMDMCFVGMRFVEECLDEAYEAERPGLTRLRYFRFPFLAEPRDKAAKAELNKLFTEFGVLSLGETQDSKDFNNSSSTHAYKSLKAAKSGRCYSVKKGPYGKADQPIALFHTKTWKKIRKGILSFLDENPTKAPKKTIATTATVPEPTPEPEATPEPKPATQLKPEATE